MYAIMGTKIPRHYRALKSKTKQSNGKKYRQVLTTPYRITQWVSGGSSSDEVGQRVGLTCNCRCLLKGKKDTQQHQPTRCCCNIAHWPWQRDRMDPSPDPCLSCPLVPHRKITGLVVEEPRLGGPQEVGSANAPQVHLVEVGRQRRRRSDQPDLFSHRKRKRTWKGNGQGLVRCLRNSLCTSHRACSSIVRTYARII